MRLRRFIQDLRANVAPIFAIAVIPVIGFVGAAVDYSRANAARTSMQTALDSTALSLSKEAPTLTQSQLNQKAGDIFNAMFKHPGREEPRCYADIHYAACRQLQAQAREHGGGRHHVHARARPAEDRHRRVRRGVLGHQAPRDRARARQHRLDGVEQQDDGTQEAARTLLDTLKKAAKKPDDLKVAIVPFDTTVNIGTGYKNENWIDYGVEDIKKKKWEGCEQDRDQPYDIQDTTPTKSDSATLFPAADCGSLVQALPLSNDGSALNAKIDQMSPNGATNVTIGLVWAWHALTANLPFTEASAPQGDLDKVIIALTDGDNTQNRWSTSQSKIDARTAAVCANIKAANIKLYTVRVIDGNATLLKNCASNPAMFYDVAQASQLTGVFTAIAQNLANLRISK